MIVGSSALNNQSNQKVVSPIIEVKLTNSYFYQGISFGGAGLSGVFPDAIYWKDAYYVYDNQQFIRKYSYKNGGLSYVMGMTIPGTSWNTGNFARTKFINEGNTLCLYGYANSSIESHSIYRYSCSNGLTWTSRETITAGISGYTILGDIAPVIGDAVYALELWSGFSQTRSIGDMWFYRRLGPSTWGGTIIYNKPLAYPTKSGFPLQALGTTANLPQWGVTKPNTYEDYVYFNYTGSTGGGLSDIFSGMRTFDCNRFDMFNEREIITNNGPGYLNIIPYGMKKGASYYYHYFKLVDSLYRYVAGYTTQEDVTIGYFYQQSRNGYQWTIPRHVGPEYFNDGTKNYLEGPMAAGGATIPEMMIFTGQTAMCLWYETNEVDISGDVINYTNRDNEDVTITLGNYQRNV